MLAREFISEEIPIMKMTDSAASALQLMEDFKLSELPLIHEDQLHLTS